jgi:phosphate transport system substrate-binding protein
MRTTRPAPNRASIVIALTILANCVPWSANADQTSRPAAGPMPDEHRSVSAFPIKIQGSSTFELEVLKGNREKIELALERKLDVIASKSSWGLLALLEGRIDLAMISAPLDAEISAARQLSPAQPYEKLKSYDIARTRLSFAVNLTNPVSSLSLEKIRDILSGAITNWQEVGGPNLPITVVAVKEGGGTLVTLRAQLIGDTPLPANAVRLESARHLLTVVLQEPGAIGIAQLGLVRKAGVNEIITDQVIEQPLSLVALADPTAQLLQLIEVTRAAAADDRK